MIQKEIWLPKALKIHGDKYDYSKVPNTFTSRDKIPIICKIHGIFYQRQDGHLAGKGCPICGHIATGKATHTKDLQIESKKPTSFKCIKSPKIAKSGFIIGSIYMFENIINHKRYIGQTTKNYKERWTEHYNAKDTFYFHNALRKYGWESFSKYVLVQTKEFENTPENLIKIQKALDRLEIYFIKKFNTYNNDFGYNLTSGGHSGYNIKNQNKNISTNINKLNIPCNNNKQPILQYSIFGNFIKEWESSYEIEKELGFKSNLIRACCNGIQSISKGYIWIHKTDDIIHRRLSIEELEKRNLGNRIVQFSTTNKIIHIWLNSSEIEKTLHISKSRIRACINPNDRHLSAGGYIWKEISLRELKSKYLISIDKLYKEDDLHD